VTHRVHTSMNTMQTTVARAARDPVETPPSGKQLLGGEHTVLTPCNLGNDLVDGTFLSHTDIKAPGTGDSPP